MLGFSVIALGLSTPGADKRSRQVRFNECGAQRSVKTGQRPRLRDSRTRGETCSPTGLPGLVAAAAAAEPDPAREEAERTRGGLEDWAGPVSASTEAFAERLLAEVHRQLQNSLEAELRAELARERAIDQIDLLVAIELVKLQENLQELLDRYRLRLESRAAEADRRAHEMTSSWALVQERLRSARNRAQMLRQEQAKIELLLHGPRSESVSPKETAKVVKQESLVRFGKESNRAPQGLHPPVATLRPWPGEEQALTEYWVLLYAWLSVLAGMEATLALASTQHASGYVALSGAACILLLGRTARLVWAMKERRRVPSGRPVPSLPASTSTVSKDARSPSANDGRTRSIPSESPDSPPSP
jgi:hypothetical protein